MSLSPSFSTFRIRICDDFLRLPRGWKKGSRYKLLRLPMSTGIMFQTTMKKTKRQKSSRFKFQDPDSPINNHFWGILRLLRDSHMLQGLGFHSFWTRLWGGNCWQQPDCHCETGCPSGVPPTDDRKTFQIFVKQDQGMSTISSCLWDMSSKYNFGYKTMCLMFSGCR